MKNLHNIEKSRWRAGEYIGYASGDLWFIRKHGDGWRATSRAEPYKFIDGQTLEFISGRLDMVGMA